MQKKIPYIAVIAHNPGLTEKPTSSVSAFHQWHFMGLDGNHRCNKVLLWVLLAYLAPTFQDSNVKLSTSICGACKSKGYTFTECRQSTNYYSTRTHT